MPQGAFPRNNGAEAPVSECRGEGNITHLNLYRFIYFACTACQLFRCHETTTQLRGRQTQLSEFSCRQRIVRQQCDVSAMPCSRKNWPMAERFSAVAVIPGISGTRTFNGRIVSFARRVRLSSMGRLDCPVRRRCSASSMIFRSK